MLKIIIIVVLLASLSLLILGVIFHDAGSIAGGALGIAMSIVFGSLSITLPNR